MHHSNINRYELDIKLTKRNTLLVQNRVLFFHKKEFNGKANKYYYIVYDYETKIQLAYFETKEEIEQGMLNILKEYNIEDLDKYIKENYEQRNN